MIRYRLICACGHEFETWFGSSAAYDKLERANGLECPACGGSKVTKAIMAPSLATGRRPGAPVPAPANPEAGPMATAPGSDGPAPLAAARQQLMTVVRRLRDEVKSKAEYVGPKFAEEARRIDAGDATDRGIYGEATREEAKSLIEDGIAVVPLPKLPEEHN